MRMSTERVPQVSLMKELMCHRKHLSSQLSADLGISQVIARCWFSAADVPDAGSWHIERYRTRKYGYRKNS